MKKYIAYAFIILASAPLFACAVKSFAAGDLPLKHVTDIALPGNATRLDYQSLDARRHLLFVAHLGDSTVDVIDTKARRVVATVPAVSKVHGVLVVPSLNTAYASATGTNEVVAIDENTFRITARMPGGIYPDGIAFDPTSKRLFVSDERGGTDDVIDAHRNVKIATIVLGGKVGNTQYDAASHHVFVNAQGIGQLVEIDPTTNGIVRRMPLHGCDGNHGLLIDAHNARAFIVCEDNATLLALDMHKMRVIGRWSIGGSPDVLALDDRRHILYIAAESGIVSMFSDGKSVSRISQGFLAPAAHTVSVDPVTGLSYWPLENINGAPLLRVMEKR